MGAVEFTTTTGGKMQIEFIQKKNLGQNTCRALAAFTNPRHSEKYYKTFFNKNHTFGLTAHTEDNELCGLILVEKIEKSLKPTLLVVYHAFADKACCTEPIKLLFERLKTYLRTDTDERGEYVGFVRAAVYIHETDLQTSLLLKEAGFKAVLVKNHFGDRDAYYFDFDAS
jgi:hypothetical protein